MIHTIKTTDIALITKTAVLKTFENEEAHLHAVIVPVKDDPVNKVRTYKVRTDFALYLEIEVPTFDAEGKELLDEARMSITETKHQLTNVEQKQDWSIQTITYAEIDAFAEAVSGIIPNNLSKTETETLQLNLVFLNERKKNAPWGVAADQWRLRTEGDLIKNINI